MIGQRLSHFEITAKLGEGGMGEVYRARDTRLDRAVAIKVLPEAFVADPERLARFEREAKVLASLSHPNIAAIHGLEKTEGRQALVMELVEGEDLEARMARGAIPLEEAIEIARQIAEALEAAHEKGVVHRDLKPANVMLTPEGQVKILDFGLAKAMATDDERTSSPSLTRSPTITHQMTRAGMLMGTAAYMSPEQARGQEADKRADIWAFGAVLFELLGGEGAFGGETASDVLAAVLKEEPRFDELPDLPPGLRQLLERCLDKDPRQRLRDIGEARIRLERVQSGEDVESKALVGPAPRHAGSRLRVWIAAFALVVLGALAAGLLARPDDPVAGQPMRLSINLSANQALVARGSSVMAFSPDGGSLVMPCHVDGAAMLCRRFLEEMDVRPIEGTRNATIPFFSPDGRWLGFVAGGRLNKVAAAGGRPFDLGANSAGAGGAGWLADGTLVYAPIYTDGLFRIAAEGGESERLTTPDRASGVLGHWWVEPLPGDEKVLFTAFRTPVDRSSIGVLDLGDGSITWIVEGGYFGRYAPSGHLLFGRDGRVFAQPFDPASARVTGPAVQVLDDVYVSQSSATAMFAVSSRGALAFVTRSSGDPDRELRWFDRNGSSRLATTERRRFASVDLSRDGREATLTVEEASRDVWTLALERGTLSRMTTSELTEYSPIWSKDGDELFYVVDVPPFQLYRMEARSPDSGRPIWDETPRLDVGNAAVSPDGRWLAYQVTEVETQGDVYIRRIGLDEPAEAFRATGAEENYPYFSPDGLWLAYQSDETGRPEIYVEPFPGPGERLQITADGGTEPVWARSGELFHLRDDKLRVVEIASDGDTLTFGAPETLFSFSRATGGDDDGRLWDVTEDGRQFLVITIPDNKVPRRVELLSDWTALLDLPE